MARQATKKQRKFAKEYVESGNGLQSALKVYDTNSPNVAANIASENLIKPNVRELIDGYAAKAIKGIQTLAETAENEAVRLKANIDQADRAGYKAVDTTVNYNLNETKASPEVQELTAKLNELLKGTD
jgi:phage terminase small subunit